MLDVVVIGGGPIGSRVACRLAQMGHAVAVLEKNGQIGQKKCCTGIISQECAKAFDIPSQVILRQTNSARVFSPSGDSILISRPETRVCIVDRTAFDRTLAHQARSVGVEYRLNSEAENISFQADKVTVEIGKSADSHRLEAQAVVLASGFNAPLVRSLGLGRPAYFVTGAQAELDINGIYEIEVYLGQKLAPGFFGWLAPTSQGKGLVGLLTHHNPGQKLGELITDLYKKGKIALENPKIEYGGIPLKPLSRTYGRRLLLIGDAAGQVKPTTGGGLYFGLICADIAAESLHNALIAGNLSATGLSIYEKKWRRRLGHELRTEYFIRRCFEHMNDRQINGLFARIKKDGIADSLLQAETVSFDWHGGLLLKAMRLGAISEVKRMFRL